MMRHRLAILLILLVLLVLTTGYVAQAFNGQPIVTDSRIKTLIFNENEVYRIVTNYGFQSNIEFAKNETIHTISLGDQVAWQVIPSESHLFLRALAENAHTNMTVITSKRKYQFDLFARRLKDIPDEELAYVIRFYYPEAQYDGQNISSYSEPQPVSQPTGSSPAFSGNGASFPEAPPVPGSTNYNYSLSGPPEIAPVQVFDDGRRTFFQFSNFNEPPQIFAVGPDGMEQPVTGQMQGTLIAVDRIEPRFSVRSNNQVVCVFNDNMSAATMNNMVPQGGYGRPTPNYAPPSYYAAPSAYTPAPQPYYQPQPTYYQPPYSQAQPTHHGYYR